MTIPHFARSSVFLTGLGVSGSGVVGIGGWQIAEGFYPYVGKQLAKEGFLESIPKPELEVSVEKGEHKHGESPFKFQSYGCFQNFFPGVTVNHSVADGSGISNSTPSNKDINSNVNPIGCALMNFSYDAEVKSQKIKYVFKSEVTAKNDKFGWALWAGSKRLLVLGNNRADYYLIFLKKVSDAWNILGGYSWMDMAIADERFTTLTNIWSPDRKEGNWYSLISNTSKDNVKGSKEYSGIWETTTWGGKEIFQDIELWAGKKEEKYGSDEILGREFKKGSEDTYFTKNPANALNYGYEKAEYAYSSDTGWTKLTKVEDITQTLNNMYAPFKGKKGSWRKTEEYCSSKKSGRMHWKERYKLQNFCYKKESLI